MALAPVPQQLVQRHIQIGNTAVVVEVADTEGLREQGLSGHTSLPEGKGMLFLFATDNTWGIWMKDMFFPIDIVWADTQGVVVTVANNIAPETYPKVFYPSAPARYVVELPAGFVAQHNLVEGDQLEI